MHYLDCLTLFCGATAHLPGALLGGKAQADPTYFDCDQLHLSEAGYQLWKDYVEEAIQSQLQAIGNKETTSKTAN